MKKIRVRFAPSPTGYLHIGGARTALYNYLFARHHGGTFILRIEDTDIKRSEEQYTKLIIDDLQWLGIVPDEGPYFQSMRVEMYRQWAERLLEKGLAYRCYCSPEELEEQRKKALKEGRKVGYSRRCRDKKNPENKPYAVRLKVPLTGETAFTDMLRGLIKYDNSEIEDFVILRSNGLPTYNFSAVVDDITLGITHIIRGDDHIANTPKQVLLYQYFDSPLPEFAHLPLIVGKDRAPLSKRHGATSISAFREMGFLRETMVNYLARLGWGYGDKEVFSMEELIELFDIKSVNLSPAVFDMDKLRWLNSVYIQGKTPDELFSLLKPFLLKRGIEPSEKDDRFLSLIKELQPRAKTLEEMAEGALFYFSPPSSYDGDGLKKFFDGEGLEGLKLLYRRLKETQPPLDLKAIENVFRKTAEETGIKMVKIAQSARLALTGKTVSPGIFEIIQILGVEESLRRFEKLINTIKGEG